MPSRKRLPIHLHVQSYKPQSDMRLKEIDYCLRKNMLNPCISKVIIYLDNRDIAAVPSHCKLLPIGRRLVYSDWVKNSIKEGIDVPHITVLANADIVFDLSIRSLNDIPGSSWFCAISRYESFRLIANPQFAQDAWAFLASEDLQNKINITNFTESSSLPLGYLGCDNRIAAIALESGFSVLNPCKWVFSHHIQKSPDRDYHEGNRLLGSYAFVMPTGYAETCANVEHVSSRCDRRYFGEGGLL